MKKEIKHSCPEDMIYSNKAGKCINPKLAQNENVNEYSADPEDRNKIPSKSLQFPKTLGKVAFPIGGKKRKN